MTTEWWLEAAGIRPLLFWKPGAWDPGATGPFPAVGLRDLLVAPAVLSLLKSLTPLLASAEALPVSL